jgi:hypothetical protein
MAQSNVVLTIPEPHRIELVERPYPKIKAGYAVVRTDGRNMILSFTTIPHTSVTRASASSTKYIQDRVLGKVTASSYSRAITVASAIVAAAATRPLTAFPTFPNMAAARSRALKKKTTVNLAVSRWRTIESLRLRIYTGYPTPLTFGTRLQPTARWASASVTRK